MVTLRHKEVIMMWWNGWGWGMGLVMLFGFLFWAAIIALVVWVVVRLTRRGVSTGGGGQTALDIARERYARGEITREQFEQIKKDLTG
jgi:putative membrane protein